MAVVGAAEVPADWLEPPVLLFVLHAASTIINATRTPKLFLIHIHLVLSPVWRKRDRRWERRHRFNPPRVPSGASADDRRHDVSAMIAV
jgi:hypothetical protein